MVPRMGIARCGGKAWWWGRRSLGGVAVWSRGGRGRYCHNCVRRFGCVGRASRSCAGAPHRETAHGGSGAALTSPQISISSRARLSLQGDLSGSPGLCRRQDLGGLRAVRALLLDYVLFASASRESVTTIVSPVLEQWCCVIWLDDLERFLGSGEFIARALVRILGKDERKVVVLATVRSAEFDRYSIREQAFLEMLANLAKELR